jgi:hypothetical protein
MQKPCHSYNDGDHHDDAGENPVSWANINYTGDLSIVSIRAKLVNQVIIALIY